MSSDVNETLTQKLRRLLGEPVVLLKIRSGEKAPRWAGWRQAQADSFGKGYFDTLDTGKHNIGVALGRQSGGLCSIDIDEDASVEPFLELNPRLRDTLRTKGKRGCNLWLRIEGDYPKLAKVKSASGGPWGEWRSDGGQTVIYGRHPDGMDYQIVVEKPVLTIRFEEINWGDLQVPWGPEPLRHRNDSEPQDGSELPQELEAYLGLVRTHGDPVEVTEKGYVKLNHPFFVAKYAVEHLILHEPAERQFYTYENARGLWRKQTFEKLKDCFSVDLKDFADRQDLPQIHFMRTSALLGSLAELLRGHVEKAGIFDSRREFIHLGNGILFLNGETPGLHPFSPDFYSRNQCPFDLVPGAQCPVFLEQLMLSALDADDIDLLQRWAGSLLLGGNVAQRILLLTGTPGGGKSTFLEVIEAIVGEENIHELRTEHLHERFELQFFIGKTLLTGKDVPGDFLQRRGASMLKKLVGNDLISPEKKGVNDILRLRGNFDVAITANSRLHVRLDGDADAWRRRLMVVRYERPKPRQRIADFGAKILREEGSGILNWMIHGAMRYLDELEAHGDYVMTERQRQRVDDLLAESDSVRAFVKACVQPATMGDATTEELVRAYRDFCEKKGWDPQPPRQVERQLPDLMLECFGVSKSHKIDRDGRAARGFAGVRINEAD